MSHVRFINVYSIIHVLLKYKLQESICKYFWFTIGDKCINREAATLRAKLVRQHSVYT
jgi:hypothetical protein